MRLSLCMIVKNEQDTLERCLASARPYVDEVVIVDTGSTDGTMEIVSRYAGVIHAMEWPGSFSVARNVSMDLATGDYIIILDADEYIPDPAHWQTIRQATASPSLLCAYVAVVNTLSVGVLKADVIVQPRIVRNVPEIRWEGLVHNQIEHVALAYGQTRPELERLVLNAEIIHTGYDKTRKANEQKHAPRLPLLRQMIQDNTGRLRTYYEYQLACTLHAIGQTGEANDLFYALDWNDLTADCRRYGHNLAAISATSNERAIYHAGEMIRAAPDEPAALFLAGGVLADAGDTRRGLLFMCEAWLQAMAGTRCRMVLRESFVLESIAYTLGVTPDSINSPQAIRLLQRRLVPPVDLSALNEHIEHAAAIV